MSDKNPQGAKRNAHERAKARDVSEYFTIGEQIDAVIREPASTKAGDEALAKVSKKEARDVRVFVRSDGRRLHRGDYIKCRVDQVGHSHLKAVLLCKLS